jgi:hypothetical protein
MPHPRPKQHPTVAKPSNPQPKGDPMPNPKKKNTKPQTTPEPTPTPTESPPATATLTPPVTQIPAAIFTPKYANTLVAPPDVVIPTPPVGFNATDFERFLGFRPLGDEVKAAEVAVTDLESFDDFVATFGTVAGDKTTLVNALILGIQWREMRDLTAAWDTYVRVQDGLAWKAALTLLSKLKPYFLDAVSQNAALATKYSGLMQMLDAPKVIATRALATRTKNAKANATKALSDAHAAGAASVTPAPSITTPAAAAAGAQGASTAKVTINT